MSADDSKRAIEEARAEKAARDLKSELKRAKALVDEARRRLERDQFSDVQVRPPRFVRKR
jgi:hypothetical protein